MNEFILIMPEIFLALTLAFVVFGEVTYHGEQVRLIALTALIGLGAAFIQTILTYQLGAAQIFNQALSVDGLSLFFKLLFITHAAFSILTVSQTREVPVSRRAEFNSLILASTLAMCLAASSADMLLAFLAMQCMNILAFFVAGYGKRSVLSVEAGVKFMIFSAVAGGFLLYGLSILFAHTHSLNIHEMHRALMAHPLSKEVMLVAFLLIFLAFGFQIAAFPMYFWAPDVLEGAPTPASSFLSFGTRAAGLAVALRFCIVVFAQPALSLGQWQVLGPLEWTRIVGVVAGISMLVGSLLAFRQQGAKRMVACLLIAETGSLLLGLLVLDQVGVAAILYNLMIQLFALVGIFYVLSFLFDEVRSDRLEALRGMMGRAVPECICLVLFLFTLVGIPPMPGFIGKFTLIGAAVRHHWLLLAMIAIVSMGISTVAVARLAFGLAGTLRNTCTMPFAPSRQRQLFLAGVVVPMLLLGVFAEAVLDWAGKSLGFILW